MTEYRAVFDADVTFRNGGGLQTQGFRLDVPGPDVTREQVTGLFIADLGLLLVDHVDLRDLRVVAEPHRSPRGPARRYAPVTGATADPVTAALGAATAATGADTAAPGAATAATGAAAGAVRPTRLVELNHPITAGMTTYPGLPGPEIIPHLTREASRDVYASGVEFAIDRISMVGNTGTYLDSPYHRYAGGADLAGVPVESVADLPVVVVRLIRDEGDGGAGTARRDIDAAVLAGMPASDLAGAAVLLHTGWDRHWGTPAYGDPAPYLAASGARLLVEAGVRLVGIDSVNIDDTHSGGERPAHSILLEAGIPVLEHLTGLADLPVTGARLHAAPPRVHGFGTFPVRAYAVVTR